MLMGPKGLILISTVLLIMIRAFGFPSTGKVSFVDYEYSGLNYAAFDIGNHFCEFAGKCSNNF